MPMSSYQEEEIYIPEAATFETLNRILLAYLRAGAYEKAVSYKDAAVRSGVHRSIVSLNNKFLLSSGFLTEGTRGTFKLSEKATRYAQLLDWGKTEEAKEPLSQLLSEYGFIKRILDFVTINKKVTKDELITKIISECRIQKIPRYITGINTLLEMLTFSGLLKEEDGTFSSGKPDRAEVSVVSLKPPLEVPPVETKKTSIIPISISITIDEKTDVEKLKAVIRALREALQE
jgi:hypothetical protein